MANKIQIRRDTTSNWIEVNPILSQGELGLDTTLNKIKIGNGTLRWAALSFYTGNPNSLINGLHTVSLDDNGLVIFPSGESGQVSIQGGELSGHNGSPLGLSSNTSVVISTWNPALHSWEFTNTGGINFPTLSVDIHNGGVQSAQVLKFDDASQQVIITGPTPAAGNSAERIIIQGQRATGNGEGGDVYLWGGDSAINGGDIKIYAGDADSDVIGAVGGYVNIDAGNGFSSGGNLTLSAGLARDGYGGNVSITAGYAYTGTPGNIQLNTYSQADSANLAWTFTNDGKLQLPAGGDIVNNAGNSITDIYKFAGGTIGTKNNVPTSNGWGSHNMYLDPGGESWASIFIPSVTNQDGGASLQIINKGAASSTVQVVGWGGVQLVTNTGLDEKLFEFRDDGKLTLPKGSIISETANTIAFAPPTAAAGQSLVIRPTAVGWTVNASGYIVYGSSIAVFVTTSDSLYFGTVNYTFSGCTAEQLGRALTGQITFPGGNTGNPQSIQWTIPANSNITTFTLTLGSAVGVAGVDHNFEYNALPDGQFVTVTNNGITNSEFSHVHLVAGDPATVDIYLGDDDQYVKIEKNAGDVVIGTNLDTHQWTFGTDGTLTLPAPPVQLINVNQIVSATINRAGAGTDVVAIADAKDLWIAAEGVWSDINTQDFQITNHTWPWTGKPSWEGYPLLMNYNSSGTPVPGVLPPTSALAPAGNNAVQAYLAYKQLLSSIDIVSGNKTFSFENTGELRVPGVINKDNNLILGSAGVSGVLPTGNFASVTVDGENGKVFIRTDNGGTGTTRTWQFDTNGNTTFPTGLTLGAPRGVNTVNFTSAIDKEFQIETQTASTGKLWRFGTDGGLTFPDNTVQTTAYRPVVSLTYSQIVALKTAGTLVPGMNYIISDFASTYDQPDFDNGGIPKAAEFIVAKTGPVEPLILLAVSTTTFSPQAWSATYPEDHIIYDINHTVTEITGTACKGRIALRIDDEGNQINYDSRGILLKRYESAPNSGIFNSFKDNGGIFLDNIPTFAAECENIVIAPHHSEFGEPVGSDDSVFLVSNNVFGALCESIITGGDFYNNTFGEAVYGVTFGHFCRNNLFLSGFYDNHILNNFSWNVIGENFNNNTIGNNFSSNRTNSNFISNDISSGFYDNTVNIGFINNTIGNDFQSNTIGINFFGNHINDYFQSNGIVGDNFQNNNINYPFMGNTVLAGFQYNTTKASVVGTDFTSTVACYKAYTSEIVIPVDDFGEPSTQCWIGHLSASTAQWTWSGI